MNSFCSLRSSPGLLVTLSLLAACGAPLEPDGDADGGDSSGGGSSGLGSGGANVGGTPGGGGAGVGGAPATGGASTGGEASGGGSTGGAGTGGGAGSGGSDGCDASVRAAASPIGFGSATTGGKGGSTVTVSTGTELHAALCGRAADDTPLVILVDGTLTPGNTKKQSGSCNTADGVIELKEIENVSIVGVGTRGVLDQVGIHVRSSSNVIIQNLTVKNVRKSNTSTPSNGGDAIGLESDVDRVWIDHNLIFGSTTEGEEHDGLIDFKDHVTNVTVSYNHLHTGGRGGLIGSNDGGDDGSTRITFHHNWYQNLNSRTHLVREADVHVFDNYYSEILETGINARNGATLLVENNYFTSARNPLGTFFYLTNPGTWEVHGNFFSSSVVWQSSGDQVPAGPNVSSTGTLDVPYSYSLDAAACVPAIVQANVGVGKL